MSEMNDEPTNWIPVPDTPDVGSDAPVAPEPSVETPVEGKPTVTFMGNNYDLASVVGLTVAGTTLFTCATCNFGFYCLPVIPILLGIVGLVSTKEAVDPDRTRLYSWLSIGIGSGLLLLLITFIVLYVGFLVFAIASAESGGGF